MILKYSTKVEYWKLSIEYDTQKKWVLKIEYWVWYSKKISMMSWVLSMILNGFEYDELSIEYLVSKTLNTQYSKKNEYGCMVPVYTPKVKKVFFAVI